jgi:hypothetical protein
LKDVVLASKFQEIKALKLKGRKLRKAILVSAEKRFKELREQVQLAVRLF